VLLLSLARQGPGRLRSLSVNPFPDIRRTIPELDASTFADYQETDRSAVDHSDFVKIDGDGPPFLIDRGTKDVHVVSNDSPADAQGHTAPFNHESVDSAGHGGVGPPDSKPGATRKLLKRTGKTGGGVSVELRILRIL
jgi:hypothetical protein